MIQFQEFSLLFSFLNSERRRCFMFHVGLYEFKLFDCWSEIMPKWMLKQRFVFVVVWIHFIFRAFFFYLYYIFRDLQQFWICSWFFSHFLALSHFSKKLKRKKNPDHHSFDLHHNDCLAGIDIKMNELCSTDEKLMFPRRLI